MKLFACFFFRRAKLLLKKKRFQEQILAKTDGQLENIEKLIHDLEFSQIEVEVIKEIDFGGGISGNMLGN